MVNFSPLALRVEYRQGSVMHVPVMICITDKPNCTDIIMAARCILLYVCVFT